MLVLATIVCAASDTLGDSLAARHADAPDLTFSVVTGLPQSEVHALFEDQDGYLWVGTGGGLVRFDGTQFRGYSGKDGLTANKVLAIVADDEHHLWVATHGGGVCRLRNSRFTCYGVEQGLPSAVVFDLAVRGDVIWVATSAGIASIQDDRITALQVPLAHVRRIIARAEDLWFLADDRLLRRSGGELHLIRPGGATTDAIGLDPDGRLWSFGQTIAMFDDSKGELVEGARLDDAADSRRSILITATAAWLGVHDRGLFWFAADGAGPAAVYSQSCGVPQARIHAIVEDREGTLWLGTSVGLVRSRELFHAINAAGHRLPSDKVWAIAEDASGGLWIATERGVAVWDPTRATTEQLDSALGGQRTTALLIDDRGTAWLGQAGRVVRLDRSGGEARVFKLDNIGAVFVLYADRDGSILAAGNTPLIRIRGDDLELVPVPKSLVGESIFAIERDRSGALWLGTINKGLVRLTENERGEPVAGCADQYRPSAGSLSRSGSRRRIVSGPGR